MWVEEIDECLKGYLPYYLVFFLSLFVLISPIHGSHEFQAYRMQHYDIQGTSYGTRSASINLEIRGISNWSSSRHCVFVRILDLSVELLRNIKSKAGGLVIILPENKTTLTISEKQHIMEIESTLLSQEVTIPVYFIVSSNEVEKIIDDINRSVNSDKKSGAEELLSLVSANGYQIGISSSNPKIRNDYKVTTLQGQLFSNSASKTSTILVVAHYDSFSVAPDLSFGANSNGSGVIVLLELIRLFSSLYENALTVGKYNIVFLLTGGGKINFLGSKKWLEQQFDSVENSDVQDSMFTICLDTLSSNDSLYMHVSKPPKEGSPVHLFFKELKTVPHVFKMNTNVEGVYKKINSADDVLAWEHERFSMRKMNAFTLSTVKNYRDQLKSTLIDDKDALDVDRLERNTKIIAESLARFIYNISGNMYEKDILLDNVKVDRSHLQMWIDIVTTQPRSLQALNEKNNVLLKTFKDYFEKHLLDIKTINMSPDKRDPEFRFYDVTNNKANIYSVKPAVFDLVLTIAIVLYLGAIYLITQKFSMFYSIASNLTNKKQIGRAHV